jgi:hypothetical protein
MKSPTSILNDSPEPINQDPTYDPKREKSELLARLDEMKRAIDGYKEYKTKSRENNSSIDAK